MQRRWLLDAGIVNTVDDLPQRLGLYISDIHNKYTFELLSTNSAAIGNSWASCWLPDTLAFVPRLLCTLVRERDYPVYTHAICIAESWTDLVSSPDPPHHRRGVVRRVWG